MKKMIIAALAVLSMSLLLIACEKTEYPTFEEKGMEIIGIMEDMINSEEYIEALGIRDEDVLGIIESAAEGDYSEAEHIYSLKFDNPADALIDNFDDLPRSLKKVVNDKAYGAYISALNAASGSIPLVAASMATASTAFATDGESAVYLYTFEDGYPIAITYVVNDEGICSAAGTFLFRTDDLDFSSAKKLEDSLDYDAKVEKIK